MESLFNVDNNFLILLDAEYEQKRQQYLKGIISTHSCEIDLS